MVHGGIWYVKSGCLYAPLFCLCFGIITHTTRHKVHRRRREHGKINIPMNI